MSLKPVTLQGKFVRLAPMSLEHAAGLARVGLDEEIWKYMRYGRITNEEEMYQWVEDLLLKQAQGQDLPFTVIALDIDQPIGATRYLDYQPENRSVEIGGTWYARAYQGTLVNTECKFLLLRHAFEYLQLARVQFKTDIRNLRSQHAIERLGAVREGILRDHMILPDGTLRSSIYYSILASEWPAVKKKLFESLK
jgi:RimJ/RimL family protein N-acetyltransferase